MASTTETDADLTYSKPWQRDPRPAKREISI